MVFRERHKKFPKRDIKSLFFLVSVLPVILKETEGKKRSRQKGIGLFICFTLLSPQDMVVPVWLWCHLLTLK
jgi:hypothetical protein